MGLFKSKKNDFSGSPQVNDRSSLVDNTNYDQATTNQPTHNTLQKRNSPANITTYDDNPTVVSPTSSQRRTGLFGHKKDRSVSPSPVSAAATQQQPQHPQGMMANQHPQMNGTNAPMAGGAMAGVGAGVGDYDHESLRGQDPIHHAQAKVEAAKAAEDHALAMVAAARAAVREAQDEVERLATQADHEAQLAASKQHAAQGLREHAGHLGRFQ